MYCACPTNLRLSLTSLDSSSSACSGVTALTCDAGTPGVGSGLSTEEGLQVGSASRGEADSEKEKEAARGDLCWDAEEVGSRVMALGTWERNAENEGALIDARDVFFFAVAEAMPGPAPCAGDVTKPVGV